MDCLTSKAGVTAARQAYMYRFPLTFYGLVADKPTLYGCYVILYFMSCLTSKAGVTATRKAYMYGFPLTFLGWLQTSLLYMAAT